MGALEPVVEREESTEERESQNEKKSGEEEEGEDLEKGGVGVAVDEEKMVDENDMRTYKFHEREFHLKNMQRLNPTNPLRIVINGGRRVVVPAATAAAATTANVAPPPHPPPSQQPPSQPRSTPPAPTPQPQISLATLNSRRYTNRISLFLFSLHMVIAIGLVGFLIFKGVQGLLVARDSVKRKEKRLLHYLLPQVEASLLLSITLAFVWQITVRKWPKFMVHFILWSTFFFSFSAGILLICFQKPPTDGLGVCFLVFAMGNGLYACWVNKRIGFSSIVWIKSLEPVPKFHDINQPTYYMLAVGFLWMSLWIMAVIGALNFYFPPLVIIALVLSLAWVTEVMRNVVNLTVSRVIALYYLRGMQSSTRFCFQRAISQNLGSACLGSLFVPAIEALRIVARVLNLLEGEAEFMFCCAPCCLKLMESIFRNGNGWAYVQIAAYGKGFVQASQDTWQEFKRQEMEPIVDSDMTSAICFLTGVCSGSICVIFAAAWTAKVHQPFTATISLLAFFVGYLMTRISMALPHACVSCYYVCYAENPQSRLFDDTIKKRLENMEAGRDDFVPTPRVPRRFNS